MVQRSRDFRGSGHHPSSWALHYCAVGNEEVATWPHSPPSEGTTLHPLGLSSDSSAQTASLALAWSIRASSVDAAWVRTLVVCWNRKCHCQPHPWGPSRGYGRTSQGVRPDRGCSFTRIVGYGLPGGRGVLQLCCGISQGWSTFKPLTTKHGRGHCTERWRDLEKAGWN